MCMNIKVILRNKNVIKYSFKSSLSYSTEFWTDICFIAEIYRAFLFALLFAFSWGFEKNFKFQNTNLKFKAR